MTPPNNETMNSASLKVVAATIIGIVFVAILMLLALLVPTPTEFQYEIFRVVLALAAAGFAAILPGAISAKFSWGIGAVGSLAVFAIVYFFSPAQLVAEASPMNGVVIPSNPKNDDLTDFISSLPDDVDVTTKEELRDKLIELFEYRKHSEKMLTSSKKEIDSLNVLIASLIKPSEIINYVQTIEPDASLADEFRQLSNNRKGPWRPSAKAQLVKISVPGAFAQGRNYSCPEHYGKKVEFRSNLYVYDELKVGEPSVTLTINGTLSSASNCREIIKHDFQLSCLDAKAIFSDTVLDCDKNNNPLWKIEKEHRIMSAYATKIYEHQDGAPNADAQISQK